MLDHQIPTRSEPATGRDPAELLFLSESPATRSGDVLPFAPNLIATIFGFGFMVIVPWVVTGVFDWINNRYDVFDDMDPSYLSFVMGITILVALGAASCSW